MNSVMGGSSFLPNTSQRRQTTLPHRAFSWRLFEPRVIGINLDYHG